MISTELLIYLSAWFLLSLFTFFLYGNDKKRSLKNKYRIQEKTLLRASFLLGSLGGLLGLYALRHKTKHWYFVVVNWLSLFLHIGVAYFIFKQTM